MMTSLANLTPEQLSSYPALQPPPGVVPNFMHPENQNRPLLVATSIELGIMIVFVLNRFYSKSVLIRKYSWDDLTVLLAVMGSIAYYVSCVLGAQKGLGVHQWDINIIEIASRDLIIPSYLIAILTPPTLLFTKITFFLLYLQVFRPMRWLRISACIGTLVTTAFYLGMTVAQFVFATPRRGETWASHQETRNEKWALAMSVPQSAVGLCIDLYILVLPVIAVSQLQLATRRKFGLMLIFMTGILACLGSTLSIYYRYVLDHSPDITWNLMPVNTVTLTEMFVGIICSCMPSAAYTCRHTLPSFDTLKSRWYSRSRSFGFTLERNSDSMSDTEKPIHSKPHGSYINRGRSKSLQGSDLAQSRTVQTVIGAGIQDGVERNGIHVDHQLQTSWEQV